MGKLRNVFLSPRPLTLLIVCSLSERVVCIYKASLTCSHLSSSLGSQRTCLRPVLCRLLLSDQTLPAASRRENSLRGEENWKVPLCHLTPGALRGQQRPPRSVPGRCLYEQPVHSRHYPITLFYNAHIKQSYPPALHGWSSFPLSESTELAEREKMNAEVALDSSF